MKVNSTSPIAVVLLSGGLDSAVALGAARASGYGCVAVSFDYGQRHALELDAARAVAAQQGVSRHSVIGVDLAAIGGSALTDPSIAVPKDTPSATIGRRGGREGGEGGGVPVTYVPARNLIFLSLAAGLAETLGSTDLYIGANAVDYSGYPDCREPFLRAFERAATLGTSAGAEHGRAFTVHSPLVSLTKAQIIRMGCDLGVDLGLTTSCYDPSPAPAGADRIAQACGRCDSCLIRARGFAEAGVSDPTLYANEPPVVHA
ncbi:MAG: 7-cyano-7-deazaguanine synthase QueC [Phycisphaeraceae bacterium]|nr:7-cyano-7-deazaguanine synthase QueC [Phycisphaeraceae bacterium]